MATVVKFWQLPEEEARLLRYVDGTGDILARAFDLSENRGLFTPAPLLEFIEERDPDAVLIGPREFMDQAKEFSVEREGQTLYGYSYLSSPLLLYDRPRFRAPRQLGQSNMCAEWWGIEPGVPDLVRKPEPFIKWAQRVFRWVRRATPKWHQYKTYRITEKVAAELERGLELVP